MDTAMTVEIYYRQAHLHPGDAPAAFSSNSLLYSVNTVSTVRAILFFCGLPVIKISDENSSHELRWHACATFAAILTSA